MKKIAIFGIGNIGSALLKRLEKESVQIKYVIRSSGIFDQRLNKIAEQIEWKNIIQEVDLAFICVPTESKGERALEYETDLLEMNIPVVTCEKASIAYHWGLLKQYKKIFRYTASVGGGTKMLKEISKYNQKDILEIKAVVNGTLNYISSELRKNRSKDDILKEVLEKGYAEPGSKSFEDVVQKEMNDVILKTVIITNHSGILDGTIHTQDIHPVNFTEGKRCIVKITRGKIEVGYIEDNSASWLPEKVDNILYINGEKKVSGPGAGAEATVSSMVDDFNGLRKNL